MNSIPEMWPKDQDDLKANYLCMVLQYNNGLFFAACEDRAMGWRDVAQTNVTNHCSIWNNKFLYIYIVSKLQYKLGGCHMY